jgi:hypothetical protein
MDIIDVIRTDHDAAMGLFDRLDPIAADDARTSEAMRVAVQLAVTIKTHSKCEEKVLYEVMRTASLELGELALEGPYEHEAMDLMLDKLLLHRPGRDFRAVLRVAREMFTHHARHVEEGRVLPAVARVLTIEERVQLGQDLLLAKRRTQPHVERLVGPPARGVRESLHIHGFRR